MGELFKVKDNVRSESLKNFLLDCCKIDPAQRLSFVQLQKYDNNYFTKILQELDITATIFEQIWKEASTKLKPTDKGIDFSTFSKFLAGEYFKLDPNSDEYHYLIQALRLPFWLKVNDEDPPFISRSQFEIVCTLFKFSSESNPRENLLRG